MEHRASLALQATHANAEPSLLHRGQQPALPQPLLQCGLGDAQRLADRLAQALAGGERRFRLQVKVGADEPADAVTLRLPALELAEDALAPAPGDRRLGRHAG